MGYNIDIFSELPIDEALIPLLHRAIVQVLQHEEIEESAEMSLVIDGDEAVHELNRQYRGYDKTTDILSFPSGDEPMDGVPYYLGDCIISLPQATRQATHFGHAVNDELHLLVVHGTLHLLGYDHTTPEEQAEMWAIQASILTELGCPVTIPQIME